MTAFPGVVAQAATTRVAQTIAGVTTRQLAVGGSVIAGGCVSYELTDHMRLSDAAEKRADCLDKAAERSDQLGLPFTAELNRAQADDVRIQEAERPFGGRLTSAMYTYAVNQWVEQDERAEQQHHRTDKIEKLQNMSDKELKHESERLDASLVNQLQQQRFSFERNEVAHDEAMRGSFIEDRVENERRDIQREWQDTNVVTRAGIAANAAFENPALSRVGSALVNEGVSALREHIVRRVELHFTSTPELPEKPGFTHGMEDKTTKKGFREQETGSEAETGTIPSYRPEEPENRPIGNRPLEHGEGLNVDFEKALDELHAEAEQKGIEFEDKLEQNDE